MPYKKIVKNLIILIAALILAFLSLCIFIGWSQRVGKIIPQQETVISKKIENKNEEQVQQYNASFEEFKIVANQDASYNMDEKTGEEIKEQAIEDGGYLCSYSSQRIMTEDDIRQLKSKNYEGLPDGKGIIRMVINEMYARYGYQFTNQDIQAYFERNAWYHDIGQKVTDMDIIYDNMSDIEKKNIELLLTYDD